MRPIFTRQSKARQFPETTRLKIGNLLRCSILQLHKSSRTWWSASKDTKPYKKTCQAVARKDISNWLTCLFHRRMSFRILRRVTKGVKRGKSRTTRSRRTKNMKIWSKGGLRRRHIISLIWSSTTWQRTKTLASNKCLKRSTVMQTTASSYSCKCCHSTRSWISSIRCIRISSGRLMTPMK